MEYIYIQPRPFSSLRSRKGWLAIREDDTDLVTSMVRTQTDASLTLPCPCPTLAKPLPLPSSLPCVLLGPHTLSGCWAASGNREWQEWSAISAMKTANSMNSNSREAFPPQQSSDYLRPERACQPPVQHPLKGNRLSLELAPPRLALSCGKNITCSWRELTHWSYRRNIYSCLKYQDRWTVNGEDSFSCCELFTFFNTGNIMFLLFPSNFDFSLINSPFVKET